MALSQPDLSELLEAFRAGDGVDVIRESVGIVEPTAVARDWRRGCRGNDSRCRDDASVECMDGRPAYGLGLGI